MWYENPLIVAIIVSIITAICTKLTESAFDSLVHLYKKKSFFRIPGHMKARLLNKKRGGGWPVASSFLYLRYSPHQTCH